MTKLRPEVICPRPIPPRRAGARRRSIPEISTIIYVTLGGLLLVVAGELAALQVITTR